MILLLLALQEAFSHDPWKSWNRFNEGSSVTYEFEGPGVKMTIRKILEKKGPEKHLLRTETVLTIGAEETRATADEPVIRTTAPREERCPLCGRRHPDAGTWSEETLQVDGRDLKCRKYVSPEKACTGDPIPRTTIWYSDEVPGQMVRTETPKVKMRLVRLEAARK